ncbi:DUF6063 family protein [Bacillus cereus]|uniref:DUF6063 family protein n=1 Tax=Bacillus cereus TaxID=1396 RepID=UPI00240741B4|nr:DUF6063 family protein [Bacillus cereus]MDF9495186.1 DUF6063 family protein [Bacillus cereus]
MNIAQIEKAAFELVACLWQRKYLPNDHALVHPYIESQEVRNCVRRLADSFGLKVVRQDKHMHILVQPHNSFHTNPISELKRTVKTYDNRINLYIMGVIWMVICSEADNDIDSKIKWENEGLSYGEIEELVTKTLNHWYELDAESEGTFSKDWSLAVSEMHKKWKLLRYHKLENGRVSYIKESKFGLIDGAVRELEKDKMVFIERTAQTSRMTPTPVFFERLRARFGNMDRYQDRYDAFKVLLEDVKETGEMGA